jgi:hypothetical protein
MHARVLHDEGEDRIMCFIMKGGTHTHVHVHIYTYTRDVHCATGGEGTCWNAEVLTSVWTLRGREEER